MDIMQGIVIGGVGGTFATVTATLFSWIARKTHDHCDRKKLYNWLSENSSPGKPFRSTRTLASWNNLTEDRVRHLCSSHAKIYLSTGDVSDRWSMQPRSGDGFIGERH